MQIQEVKEIETEERQLVIDELCVCGETEENCVCPLGFFNREYDAVVQTNPPDQQKCYCEVALQPGFDCGLLGWRPDDPEAFQLRLIKKIYSALRRDWGQDRNDHLALDLVICPAEAQWIVKALKANIRHESIIAAKE